MNWEDNKWTWTIGAIVVLVVLYFIFLGKSQQKLN